MRTPLATKDRQRRRVEGIAGLEPLLEEISGSSRRVLPTGPKHCRRRRLPAHRAAPPDWLPKAVPARRADGPTQRRPWRGVRAPLACGSFRRRTASARRARARCLRLPREPTERHAGVVHERPGEAGAGVELLGVPVVVRRGASNHLLQGDGEPSGLKDRPSRTSWRSVMFLYAGVMVGSPPRAKAKS